MWTLVIWTVIAIHGKGGVTNHDSTVYRDWRPIAQTQSAESCHKAARQLGFTSEKQYRCISPS